MTEKEKIIEIAKAMRQAEKAPCKDFTVDEIVEFGSSRLAVARAIYDKIRSLELRADIADRAFELLCKQANDDAESYGYCSSYKPEEFYEQAEFELKEEANNARID